VRWAIPAPTVVAVWLAVTVVAPLLHFEFAHLWEEDQDATPAARWAIASTPFVSIVTAAASARRPQARAVAVMVGAAASGWVLLAVALVGWLWIIPLDGSLDVAAVAVPTGALVAVGAVLGYAVGKMLPAGSDRRTGVFGYVVGVIVALVGALLAPTVVRLGAEDSTVGFRFDGTISRDGVLPAAGRYAIFGFDEAPRNPDCRVTGGGGARRRADVVTVRPADYEGDATSLMWVATFTASGPGTYEVTCSGDWAYTVGVAPQVNGAVGSLIHWPLVLILLLGSLPGAVIVANTARRRRKHSQVETAD
jgi:hypothetical protein